MATYYVRGVNAGQSTAATDQVLAALWNPHASRRIRVVEASLFWPDFDVAGAGMYISRTTTRGTPGSTVTPDADNADDGATSPPSGALLDLSVFTVQPTLATPPVAIGGPVHTGNGSGFLAEFPRGFWLPPSQGIAIVWRTAGTMSGLAEVSYVFED